MVTNPFLCNGEAGFQVNGWVDKQMTSPLREAPCGLPRERAWWRIFFCVMDGAGFQVNVWVEDGFGFSNKNPKPTASDFQPVFMPQQAQKYLVSILKSFRAY